MILLKIFSLTLIFAYVYGVLYPIAVRLPLLGNPPLPGAALWPKPLKIEQEKLFYYLNKLTFKFEISTLKTNKCEREIIDSRSKYYLNILFPPKLEYELPSKSDLILNKLIIEIENSKNITDDCKSEYYPDITDTEAEKYTLRIKDSVGKLVGSTVWGVLRGLETFSQLIYQMNNTAKLAINETFIEDKPRFAFRGIMLDTARHYYPIPLIKKHLDAASYNKFNVFHWHLTDDQSFPFQSDVFPDLWKKGAYTPKHVYSKKDIADIIEFARIRGIRVIPEFDTPGHTASWGLGYPDLITVCWANNTPYQAIYNKHGAKEILNPMKNYTYEFIDKLLNEVKNVFTDPFIHLGMDEVYYSCWESNPEIKDWMKENNFNLTKDIEQYYMSRILNIANNIGYKVTVWQDVFDNNVKVFDGTIIQVWKNSSEKTWEEYVKKVTKEGYKVILSSPWYLNYIKYGIDWPDYYKVEPLNFNGTNEQNKLVIGGETCMWAEFVDGTNSLARMWPRASAVAERLWSNENVRDPEEAKFRLDEHRCRMLRRGIDAQPILNGYCGDYEAYFENSLLHDPIFNYNNNKFNNGNRLKQDTTYLSMIISFLLFIIMNSLY